MKNVVMILLAIFLAVIVWHIVASLVGALVHAVITIGVILLFCWLVFTIFKAMNRERI
jgi:hypothetical protein